MMTAVRSQPLRLRHLLAYVTGRRDLVLAPPPPTGTERSIYEALGATTVSTIFDVGAFHGDMAQRFARSFPTAKVYCFEPVATSYEALTAAVRLNANIHCYNVAISDVPGRARMTVRPGRQSNKLLTNSNATAEADADGHIGEVTVDTIDAFCQRHHIERVDIIKTDTEGFDGHVLRGARGMLDRTQFILAEVTFLAGNARHTSFKELTAELQGRGFEVRGVYEPAFDRNRVQVYVNALYGRR